jgi:3-dehydroquinate dehydratase/shikimate dehydrogenase
MMLTEIHEAGKQGAQLIELRLDFLANAPDFKQLLDGKPCPMVVTVRRQQDGGRWAAKEDQRQTLIRQAVVAGFDWVDLETDIADKIPRFRDVKRIVSYHNLREMPPNLEEIHARMCKQDADVVKLAVRAEHPLDNLRVLKLSQKSTKPTVAVCTGDMGTPSRVLAAKFGAPFSYAAFNKERGIAPGILSYEEMRKVYHYDAITPDTKVFGVIGDPVAHSLSPLIHNAAFRAIGNNSVYVPFRIPRVDLADSLREFEQLPVHGYSVTIPHKEAAATLAQERAPEVEWTKAANTLIRQEGNGFTAQNTDVGAAVESLRVALQSLDEPLRLTGRTVLIVGAGGVARAIARGLTQEGALPTITNRTLERAQKLAEEVGCRYCDWAARHTVITDVLINCTPVGMHPNVDESPVHHSVFRPGMLVFDTVYTPETTLLIREARDRGCRILTGVDMFVRQAAMQFTAFSGQAAPLDLMRRLVKRALSPVTLRDDEEAS